VRSDQDVEPAELVDRPLERCFPLGGDGQVGADGDAAELARGVLDLLGATDERHRRPRPGECLGHAATETASAAGHERTASREVEQVARHAATVLDYGRLHARTARDRVDAGDRDRPLPRGR
jgi:hypothetical protein